MALVISMDGGSFDFVSLCDKGKYFVKLHVSKVWRQKMERCCWKT